MWLAVGAGSVWVTLEASGVVARYDPRSRSVTRIAVAVCDCSERRRHLGCELTRSLGVTHLGRLWIGLGRHPDGGGTRLARRGA
jgi:hypothetical protein